MLFTYHIFYSASARGSGKSKLALAQSKANLRMPAISFVHLGHISSSIHELLNCMSPSIANLCLIKQRANRSAEYQGSCMSNTALAMGNRESISPFLSELTFVSMAASFSHTTQSRKRSKYVKPAVHIASCL